MFDDPGKRWGTEVFSFVRAIRIIEYPLVIHAVSEFHTKQTGMHRDSLAMRVWYARLATSAGSLVAS